MYVLDNTASNYIYGRQAMSSALSWQNHGCYSLSSTQYFNFPLDKALHGCKDDWNSLDHRDPSAPAHNVIKAMYHLRTAFPVLNDGFWLEQLSNLTHNIYLPGSSGVATETGIWSMVRAPYKEVQNFTGSGAGNQKIWMVFTNYNETTDFEFDCEDDKKGLYSPFEKGTIVQNLFFPYEEYELGRSNKTISTGKTQGCLSSLQMPAWGYKALVPKEKFIANRPAVTKFTPGHDARVRSKVAPGKPQDVEIGLVFTNEMDCDKLKEVISVSSHTERVDVKVSIDLESAICQKVENPETPPLVGSPQGIWEFKATLRDVYDGVHTVSVSNATTKKGGFYTSVNAHDSSVASN